LARETSPYLLQHAHNPVDWYPWDPEAFEAARTQDKPIFLSVGYSTCYWCHVMERQSFENEAVAREMNQRFINIKVDREERPDVDQLYMTAVQVLTRHGGWPMSVFLLPDLRPFYGGTYFSPTDSQGRPGFVTILRAIEDAYRNRRDEVNRSADQLVSILKQLAEPLAPSRRITIDWDFIDGLIERSIADYDPVHGGFGAAPKFPRETLLEMLLVYLRDRPVSVDPQSRISNLKSRISKALRHTLDAMANGGIRDHLGGGFHRYSTDAQWLVPHFEIMLYDNAMLGWCYVEAYRQTEDRRYASIARDLFWFVHSQMTSPHGAFYTAFDAEVDAQEGASYLWTPGQVEEVLGSEDAKFFNRIYGLDQGPNFADPHHGTGIPDKNVLYLSEPHSLEDEVQLMFMRSKLVEARRQRKQPLLDTKIITSWNALMIRALAHGGKILNEPNHLEWAAAAADFLLRHHREPDGSLYRTSRNGVAKYTGFLDDYAFLAQALLALQDAGAIGHIWQDHAASVTQTMIRKFGGAGGGLYFSDKDSKDLIVRQKVATDSPLPSGNAVAAMVMLALDDPDAARGTVSTFAAQLEQQAEAMSSMLQAAMLYANRHGELIVTPRARESDVDRPLSPQELAERVVGVSTVWHDSKQLEVKLQILKPFHINAHAPSPGLIPTELSVRDGADVEGIEYAPGEQRRFAFADALINVYDGEASILVRFKRAPSANVRLTLKYQPCDESACLPAVRRDFDVARGG
jgi:uncharacterized protein YyaL (SSP411 family)